MEGSEEDRDAVGPARWAPEGPRLYHAVRGFFVPLWRRAWRITVAGAHHVPQDGPAILVANHLSMVDHFAVAALTPRWMANLAHREAFRQRGLGWFLRGIGAVPVARQGGDGAALDLAAAVLERGGLVCLYPEGDWSPDGRLHRFHTGAVRLARATGAPLVPVGIRGTLEARRGKGFRIGVPVHVAAGEPLRLPAAGSEPDDARRWTEELRRRVQALSGQALAEAYAHPASRARA